MGVEAGLEVRTGGEAATGAGHQHGAHGSVGSLALDHLLELVAELGGPRVERLRAVEGDAPDGAGLLPLDGLVAHVKSLLGRDGGPHWPVGQ